MDCTFKTENGNFNYRVGVIISDGRKILMARNPNEKRKCYYSVGGRVKFGETMEEAALREVREEIDIECEIGRLVCIHENFFTDENGVFYHELSCYFTIKPNSELLKIPDGHLTDDGPNGEYLEWIDMDNQLDFPIYPEFFRKIDFSKDKEFRHFITRE